MDNIPFRRRVACLHWRWVFHDCRHMNSKLVCFLYWGGGKGTATRRKNLFAYLRQPHLEFLLDNVQPSVDSFLDLYLLHCGRRVLPQICYLRSCWCIFANSRWRILASDLKCWTFLTFFNRSSSNRVFSFSSSNRFFSFSSSIRFFI